MDQLSTGNLGGMPRTLDDLRWFLGLDGNQGIAQALNNMLGSFGTDFVVQGCEVTGTAPTQSLSEGWIILSGELLKVDSISGTLNTGADYTFTKDVSQFDTSGAKTMQSLDMVQAYRKDRGILNGGAGTLDVLTGARYKDQFDAWKEHDISGINVNLVGNDGSFGTGSPVNLHQGNIRTNGFKYKLVGKTVYWTADFDFHLNPNTTPADYKSIVIQNLPWTAKGAQSSVVRLDCLSGGSTAETSFLSHTALLNQQNTDDKMTISMSMFSDTALSINRHYILNLSLGSGVSAQNTGDASITQWIVRGSGTFETE